MPRSQRLLVLSFSGLLACSADPPPTQAAPEAAPTAVEPTPIDPGVTPPPGFVAMDPSGLQRLRAATIRGTATEAELDAWMAPGGAADGLVVSMNTRHAQTELVHGHTLRTWVQHNLRAVEAGLIALDPKAEPPKLEEDPAAQAAVLTHYALPLPGGGTLRVRSRHWLSAQGHLVDASCQCAGSGCSEPPVCTLALPPDDALAVGTVLGTQTPATILKTSSGDARVQAPPHLSPLPAALKAELEASDAEKTPRRSDRRVQGLNAADGSGVVLTEATWCAEPPACDAQTLAENRRKAEVASLRTGGTLRSIETHADPHADVPMYGFEIDQRDGFWTRTSFWNDGDAVREVSCSCARLACALAKRTCTIEPASPTPAASPTP